VLTCIDVQYKLFSRYKDAINIRNSLLWSFAGDKSEWNISYMQELSIKGMSHGIKSDISLRLYWNCRWGL